MSITCVVQARMGSTRLPGKVLTEVAGQPMLSFLLERLRPLEVEQLVVATTRRNEDDAVAEVAARAGAAVVRGAEVDVLSRFMAVLDVAPAEVVVRLTADCPLVDPAVVAEAIDLREGTGADYASNTLVRTFPDGLDVEVLTADSLREAAAEASDPVEREHVTPFVYRRPGRYRLVALRVPELVGDERWTVDTAGDLERIRRIVSGLACPARAGWREILATAPPDVPAPGALRLRPAVAEDEAVVHRLSRDPAVEAVGSGVPPVGIVDHLHDPSVRTWVVEVDGSRQGWVQVAIDRGTGHLQGAVAGHGSAEIIGLVRQVLADDKQVIRLVV